MNFLHFLAQYRTPEGEIIFQIITWLAQELFAVAVICWLFWNSDKRTARFIGFSYFTSGLLIQGLKITFRIPRPWILDPSFQPVASALPDATGYSFPSGHTQSAAALFGSLGFYFRRKYARILCFLMVLAVMFSRMYLGCHTPRDVLVSLLVSAVCVILCHRFFYIKDFAAEHKKGILCFMAAACILLAAYAVLLHGMDIIEIAYAQDCLKASGAGLAFSIGIYIEETHIRFPFPHSLHGKIIRFLAGLAGTAILLEGLKPLLGDSLAASFIRYFITVTWIVVLYPFLFTRYQKE